MTALLADLVAASWAARGDHPVEHSILGDVRADDVAAQLDE